MKNIHVLPTHKPSRLISSGKEFNLLDKFTIDKRCKHIYITSDEEIKEEHLPCYVIYNNIVQLVSSTSILKEVNEECSGKVIITTEQDLIKDGVQAIDNEFLEWFVKNSSCEEVLVTNLYGDFNPIKYEYKIIISKEEPKQETLEEAAERYIAEDNNNRYYNDFINGAKWQQERMYSEEEVLDLLNKREQYLIESVGEFYQSNLEWFEKFKK